VNVGAVSRAEPDQRAVETGDERDRLRVAAVDTE
jgi:hypothetical protein